MKVDFWQLSRDPVEKVVALIARRVTGEGERLLVVSKHPDQREAISRALWSDGPESFLAHGAAGDKGEARQPILMSETPEAPNSASHIIFADGEYRPCDSFVRAFLLFDDASVEAARGTWRSLDAADGVERAFFRQDGGKWTRVA